jgi:hypothetical protein
MDNDIASKDFKLGMGGLILCGAIALALGIFS